MHVDRAEPRDVERCLRDLPGEAPAEHQVGLVGPEERLDRVLVAREEEVEAVRGARIGEEQVRRQRRLGAAARPEQGDGIVAEVAERARRARRRAA